MNLHNILICPVCLRKRHCEVPLIPNEGGRAWVCPDRHSFDTASAGYLNLLPPSGKQTHGDNKEMIAARRRLLDSGLYLPLRDALTAQVEKRMPSCAVIWDSGCGEGYYTAEVARFGEKVGWTVYGSDLSRDALKTAGKRSDLLRLVAASSYALPAATASCDALLCLFAPQAIDEFLRVLKPGGYLIQAVPGERHLFGLKEAVYETPYENKVARQPHRGFEIAECIEIRRTETIEDPQLISALFGMTPYAYKTSREGVEKVESLTQLVTELHFCLFIYRKKEV